MAFTSYVNQQAPDHSAVIYGALQELKKAVSDADCVEFVVAAVRGGKFVLAIVQMPSEFAREVGGQRGNEVGLATPLRLADRPCVESERHGAQPTRRRHRRWTFTTRQLGRSGQELGLFV